MGRPSVRVVRLLLARSGNQCAFPNCVEPITDLASGLVTGEIAHIKADSPGGPRYDPDQSEEERQGFDNLLILCPEHHKIVDTDQDRYTVSMLKGMKTSHESKQHQSTVVVLAPTALDHLHLTDENDLRRFEEQLSETRLGVGHEDPHGGLDSSGFFFCQMYPGKFDPRRFGVEQQERALETASYQLGGFFYPRFEPDGRTSIITGDGWRTTISGDGEHASSTLHAWVLRASGLFVFGEELYSQERRAEDERGRKIINPIEIVTRVQRMVLLLDILYTSLGMLEETIFLRVQLKGMAGRVLNPLDPRRQFAWLGPYVSHDDVVQYEQVNTLETWRQTSSEQIVRACRDLFFRFQWRRNADAAIRAWLQEITSQS